MIRFMYNGLKTEDGKLHKVWYSQSALKHHPEGTITVYAHIDRSPPKVAGLVAENHTEIQSDYFGTDTIRVTPDNPHYPAVRAAYQKQEAHRAKTRTTPFNSLETALMKETE